MKKYALLMAGLTMIAFAALQLSVTGCKPRQLINLENASPDTVDGPASEIAYGYRLISVGAEFPDTPLNPPGSREDRSYLGLKSDPVFSIKDIQADLVLVELLNVHCMHCQAQAPIYNNLFERIQADAALRDEIKMLGVAAGNSKAEIKEFRQKYEIPFPIVPDQWLELHEAIGRPGTPFSVLVRLAENSEKAMVALTYLGFKKEYESLYQDMIALKSLDFAILRKRHSQAEKTVITVRPPVPQSEIVARIKQKMAKAGAWEGNLTEFRKLSLDKDRHVYTGIKTGNGGKSRLFAEVVGRPTLCDVCHDVHFFYLFNQKGKILDFVPLQLTKWGNKKWSEEDVKLMRDRLAGRSIFTSFAFNPQLDAVTSATITSAVIFDGMSQGKELFEMLKHKGLVKS